MPAAAPSFARPPPRRRAVPDSIACAALPESNLGYGDRVLSDMHRQATSEVLIRSRSAIRRRLFPVEEISEAVDATLREEPERALQYSDVQGLLDLAEQITC